MTLSLPVIAAGAGAALCFVLFGLLHSLVEHGHTKTIDRNWLKAQRDAKGAPRIGKAWVPVMVALTQIGGPVLRYLIAAPLAYSLYQGGHEGAAGWLVAALGSGWIADTIAKKVFHRERPKLVPHLAKAGGPSFPSGHTFNALLVYSALAVALAPLIGAWLAPALFGCVLLSFAVAYSRVWLGVHWPSDVSAGWLLGAGWFLGSLSAGWLLQAI